MKIFLRNIVLACIMSLCLSLSAHATHEDHQQSVLYDRQQAVPVKSQTPGVYGYSFGQHPGTDWLWLVGAFLVSLTGLVILRFLYRK